MLRSILKQYFGHDSFRGIQEDIIGSICAGRDTLGLMPTGGGKSICFQVPALSMEGVCIVVTPLIALMKDQVQHLRKKGILATAIYSGMTHREILQALDNSILGGVKILYVSPERIGTELFLNKLKRINVSFVTVDEAHCISQWGYDFRPAYLRIADIRKAKPEVPILALTATATPEVVEDILQQLEFREKNVFRMSFERKNLAYVVRETEDKPNELLGILNGVPGSSIIYVRSRERTKAVADWLNEQGITATHYHAGLKQDTRDSRQQDWQADRVRVMVATNAFGMGIDKPNVRVVVHIDCPDSPEAYFQEAGRAGRDGKKAYAVLLYQREDTQKLKRHIKETFPEKEYIRQVYEHLACFYQIGVGSGGNHTFAFDPMKFCHYFHHNSIRMEAALNLLQQAGYIEYHPEPDGAARLRFLMDRNDLDDLRNLSPDEDAVVTALLRSYGGLFVDFVYINEAMLAQRTGLGRQQVYQILTALRMRRIVEYIPQREDPRIFYCQDRVPTERIHIPPSVYEHRREEYEKRIQAMMTYATGKGFCRSRFLLGYFGEECPPDYHCGRCDFCVEENKSEKNRRQETANAQEKILEVLKDGKPHKVVELEGLAISREIYDEAWGNLLREEVVRLIADETAICCDRPQ